MPWKSIKIYGQTRRLYIQQILCSDYCGKAARLKLNHRPAIQTALLYSLCVRPAFSHKELNLKELALLDDGGEGGHLLEDGLPVLGVATAA